MMMMMMMTRVIAYCMAASNCILLLNRIELLPSLKVMNRD
jgi:hypothetical protein